MDWFRTYRRLGARIALLALAIQLVATFGHVHAQAQTSPFAAIAAVVDAEYSPNAGDPDRPSHPPEPCAICAVMAATGSLLLATSPILHVPEAFELAQSLTAAVLRHAAASRSDYQSRAPPLS